MNRVQLAVHLLLELVHPDATHVYYHTEPTPYAQEIRP